MAEIAAPNLQQNTGARCLGSGRTATAVDIELCLSRQLIVDHMFNALLPDFTKKRAKAHREPGDLHFKKDTREKCPCRFHLNIQAACRNIGGHEHRDFALLEAVKVFQPLSANQSRGEAKS